MRARAVDLELQRAAKAGNAKLMKQLLARGGRLDAQDPDGWTALHAAAAEGRTSVVHVICSVRGSPFPCPDVHRIRAINARRPCALMTEQRLSIGTFLCLWGRKRKDPTEVRAEGLTHGSPHKHAV